VTTANWRGRIFEGAVVLILAIFSVLALNLMEARAPRNAKSPVRTTPLPSLASAVDSVRASLPAPAVTPHELVTILDQQVEPIPQLPGRVLRADGDLRNLVSDRLRRLGLVAPPAHWTSTPSGFVCAWQVSGHSCFSIADYDARRNRTTLIFEML
jgi:hypothetical protein